MEYKTSKVVSIYVEQWLQDSIEKDPQTEKLFKQIVDLQSRIAVLDRQVMGMTQEKRRLTTWIESTRKTLAVLPEDSDKVEDYVERLTRFDGNISELDEKIASVETDVDRLQEELNQLLKE